MSVKEHKYILSNLFQLTDQRLGKLADWVTRNNITVVKLDSTQKVSSRFYISNWDFWKQLEFKGWLWGRTPLVHRHLLGRNGLRLPTEGQDQGLQGVHRLHCHTEVLETNNKNNWSRIFIWSNNFSWTYWWCTDLHNLSFILLIDCLKVKPKVSF